MKTLLFSLLFTATALAEHHQEAPAALPAGLPALNDPEALTEAGFTALFNGTDLTGWKKVGGTGEFETKDGAIRGFGTKIKKNTFLRTEEEFGDFIFTFQFKFLDTSGNSGCMFRAFQKGGTEDGRVSGYQCEHDNFKTPQRAWTGGIFDEARRGWFSPNKNAPQEVKDAFTAQGEKLIKWEDWNTIVIRCQGHRLQTYLNGELRCDITDTDEEHADLKGFIALQVHGGKSGDILWKNLFLKKL